MEARPLLPVPILEGKLAGAPFAKPDSKHKYAQCPASACMPATAAPTRLPARFRPPPPPLIHVSAPRRRADADADVSAPCRPADATVHAAAAPTPTCSSVCLSPPGLSRPVDSPAQTTPQARGRPTVPPAHMRSHARACSHAPAGHRRALSDVDAQKRTLRQLPSARAR